MAQEDVVVEDLGEAPMEISGEDVSIPQQYQRQVSATVTRSIDGRTVQEIRMVSGYYSPTLQCAFVISRFRLGPHTFFAAKLLDRPDPSSPLNRLGLQGGDLITRLDDFRVNGYNELERHYAETSVRYIRARSGRVYLGSIDIDATDLNP